MPKYHLRQDIMASDFPDILDAAFKGDIHTIVADAINRFTLDDNGNAVQSPKDVMSPGAYIRLATEATRLLGFSDGDDGKNE